jgi:hypothetical protein
MLAALPIGSSLKANDLLALHNQLIDGLLNSGICVVSYSCDGAVTERKVASLFLQGARDTQTTLIPHPRQGFSDIPIVIHRFGASLVPIVTSQDLKHAMKTSRNTLYSGTHSLIIGNQVVHYLQIAILSAHPESPLFQRDVFKVDRQDDRGSGRVFSSKLLGHTIQISDEHASGVEFKTVPLSIVSHNLPPPVSVIKHGLTGLAALLFVLGDAFDAFQSRSLDIFERITMILRLFFFLEVWKSSLKTLGYSEAQHYITRDFDYILNNLVHSFLSLVLIHRDMLDHPHYPLCPWLHSTEGCEHTFGEARKVKPDFDTSDFFTMAPKLNIMSIAAVQTGDSMSDANARASGYSHTLYSKLGIDINNLSRYPAQSLVNRAAVHASQEAEAIFSRCGIAVTPTLCPPPSGPLHTTHSSAKGDFIAPSIDEWFNENDSEYDDDAWVDPDMACAFDEEPRRLTHELNTLLEQNKQLWGTTGEIDDQMAGYEAASMALDLEERDAM